MTNYELPQMKYPEQKGLISIIVPIYNNEIYIRECLESILAQTFTSWEAICVYDGSTDNTGKIIDEYAKKDSRFIVIRKQNGGTLLARKTGLENSRGEFIANINHGDTYHPQFLEKMYKRIIETNADFVYCKHNRSSHILITDYNWNLDISENVAIVMDIKKDIACYTWNKLIKREIFTKVSFPNIHLTFGEDLIIILQIAYNSKSAAFVLEKLYFYRGYDITAKRNFMSFVKCVVSVKECLGFLFNGHVPYNVKNAFYCRYAYSTYHLSSLSKKEKLITENKYKPFMLEFIKRQYYLLNFYEWAKNLEFVKCIKRSK